jgi:hypothetical protein
MGHGRNYLTNAKNDFERDTLYLIQNGVAALPFPYRLSLLQLYYIIIPE